MAGTRLSALKRVEGTHPLVPRDSEQIICLAVRVESLRDVLCRRLVDAQAEVLSQSRVIAQRTLAPRDAVRAFYYQPCYFESCSTSALKKSFAQLFPGGPIVLSEGPIVSEASQKLYSTKSCTSYRAPIGSRHWPLHRQLKSNMGSLFRRDVRFQTKFG